MKRTNPPLCRFRVTIYDKYYIDVDIEEELDDSQHAEHGDEDARAMFIPVISKWKLGWLVLQKGDLDSETIAHEAFHIIEECKQRIVKRFNSIGEREEFFAQVLEGTVRRLSSRLDRLGF